VALNTITITNTNVYFSRTTSVVKWFTYWLSVRGRSLPSHGRMKRNTIK